MSFINIDIYIFLNASSPNYQQNMQSLSGRILLDSAEAPQLWLFRGLRPELAALSFFLSPFIGGTANPSLKYRIIPYLTMCLVELIWDTLFLVFRKIGADFHNETVQLSDLLSLSARVGCVSGYPMRRTVGVAATWMPFSSTSEKHHHCVATILLRRASFMER